MAIAQYQQDQGILDALGFRAGQTAFDLPTGTPVNGVAATLTTVLAGANNDLVFTAVTKGTAGNAITIAYVNPGTETATETVTVTGSAISVTLRSVSSVLSTATQVKTAIDNNTAAHALVTVANSGADNGTGAVIALAATHLAGGVDGTVARAGQVMWDATYLYLATADGTVSSSTGVWHKIALGSPI